MDASNAGNRGIAWIGATNMRTTRCLQTSLVIFLKHEGVVPLRVCPELGIIMERAQRERSATAPTAHHLGCQQFFFVRRVRIRLEKAAKVGNPLMKLTKNDVRAVVAEYFRRGLLHAADFVRVAEHEFTGFEWLFMWIRSRNAAAFDRGMTDSIAEAEGLFFVWQRMTVLAPDGFNSGHRLIGFAGPRDRRFEPFSIRGNGYDDHVDI